jgi:hypothetical protein
MGSAAHVATHKSAIFQSESLKEKCHIGDKCVDEKMILKCILKKLGVRTRVGSVCLRIGTTGSRETANELQVSRRSGKSR